MLYDFGFAIHCTKMNQFSIKSEEANMRVLILATFMFMASAFVLSEAKNVKRAWSPFDDHQFLPNRPQELNNKTTQC